MLNKTFSLGPAGALNYMNRKTTDIDLSKDFIVIDLSNVPDLIKDAMNVLITGVIGQRFRTDTERGTVIAVDEARVFLRNPELSNFLLTTLTQGRSHSIALWLLTQQATDLIKTDVAEEFQTNVFLKMVLGLNITKDNIKHVADFFSLDEHDKDQLMSCAVGEGLLIVGDNKIPVSFKPTQLEMDVIKGKYIKHEKNQPLASESETEINITSDLLPFVMDHGFCLDDWAKNDFRLHGYQRQQVANVLGAGTVTAWIREENFSNGELNFNMKMDHYSTVLQIAGALVLAGAQDVKVNHSTDVDISFIANDESYGLEYERDGSHTEHELIEKKTRAQRSYSNVFFISNSAYEKKLADIIGKDFVIKRGAQLRNFITTIT